MHIYQEDMRNDANLVLLKRCFSPEEISYLKMPDFSLGNKSLFLT